MMKNIRTARIEDALIISQLLEQLDYPETSSFIHNKIELALNDANEELFVYEVEDRVVAFISIYYIPQIALKGDFARICYFAVDQGSRNMGIGEMLEEYCTQKARERGCDRIELHSHSRRSGAHRFYVKHGYEESPKYLMKKL